MTPLRLVCVGAVPPNVLTHLERELATAVPWVQPCREDETLDSTFALDPSRGQVCAPDLLTRLATLSNSQEERILGITESDLFIPVFSFVFGQGHVGGPAAVVSLRRLRPEAYGLPPAPRTFLRRAAAESIHELGHTFSLHHCEDFTCIMHASRTADEIDQRGLNYCPECVERIEAAGIRTRDQAD